MIRTLQLQNFKCFEDEEIDLGRLTLLAGLNGMGKSSVLQSLLLLRQSYQQGLLSKKLLALNGELVALGTAQDILFEEASKDKIGFGVILKDGTHAQWEFKYNREADVLKQISPTISKNIFKSSLFNDHFHYLQAERIGPRVTFDMSDYMVRRHHQLGSKGEYTAHFLHLFGTSIKTDKTMHHEKAKSNDLGDEVEAWVSEVSPGTRIEINPYSELDLMNLQYSFERGKQVSNAYRSTNVGFGITYTLSVIVALLSSAKGDLVLLENPEAHLHPKGQVQMGKLIALAAKSGVQVIVETHSDHILNSVRLSVHTGTLLPEDISLNYFEQRDYDSGSRVVITTPQIDKNGRIDYWPPGFFDQFEKSLDALLRSPGK